MSSVLLGCLRHGDVYDEATVWPALNVSNNQDQKLLLHTLRTRGV